MMNLVDISYILVNFKLSMCSECCFLSFLGESPAPEFYLQAFRNTLFCSIFVGDVNRKNVKLEQTESSETSAHKIQASGNHPTRKNITNKLT